VPEDYEKEVTIKGFDGTTNRTIKVTIDGQLYTLLVGANGVVVAVDADGNMSTIMQGTDGVTLKTLLCDSDGRLLAQLMGMYGTTVVPVAVSASGRLLMNSFTQSNVEYDPNEAQSWDVSLVSLVNNLNRIRYMLITITGEAWGTVSRSIAAVWAKFHATTGHKHTGTADDAPVLPYSGLSGKPDTDLTPYTKIDGTRAFTGDQSMGSHKLTSVTDPGAAQDAATRNYVLGRYKCGKATIPNGSSSVTVTHGCGTTPVSVIATGDTQYSDGAISVNTIGATTFNIYRTTITAPEPVYWVAFI
jgi:hypothetical protein